MLSLVRSLVLGESITTTNHHHHHHHHHHLHNDIHHDDHDHDHHHHHYDHHDDHTMMMMKKKKMPMLLFTPTKELISDTFRLAAIARDIGMEFRPSSSLSHLLFSLPPPPSPSPPPYVPPSSPSIVTNYRTSVSSQASTFTHTSSTSSSAATMAAALRNDGVPIPFPTLSTNSSISLLRSFVSMSKGLFKLVFIDLSANPNPNLTPNFLNYYHDLVNYDAPTQFSLFSRVSGKQVKSIDDLSGELAAKGWSLFRTSVKRVSPENSVYLFRKMDPNRVRVKIDGVGECSRVRELRLPAIDFEKGMNLRVLLYILLMADDVFYLA